MLSAIQKTRQKQDNNLYFHPLRVILQNHINDLKSLKTGPWPDRLELNNVSEEVF